MLDRALRRLFCALSGHELQEYRTLWAGSTGGVRAFETWKQCSCGAQRTQVTLTRPIAPYPEQPTRQP